MYSKTVVLVQSKICLQAIPSQMNQYFELVLLNELIKLVYKWFISESHIFFFNYSYSYPIITTDQKFEGNSKSVWTLVLGVMIVSILNNKNLFYSFVSDGPGDAQSPSTEEPPTPTESPEVKEGS